MVWVVNKSERAYNIGGVLLSPLVPTQIDDSFLNNARVKEIIADGSIEQTNAPSGHDESATSNVAKSGEQRDSNKPVDNRSKYKPSGG
jgi:hypothetical protein